jgi:hypothetical protein
VTNSIRLAILNGQVSSDFDQSLDLQAAWNIRDLDLKDQIYGKTLLGLTDDELNGAAAAISQRDMSVYCLSTTLFEPDIDIGREAFYERALGPLPPKPEGRPHSSGE